MNCCWICNAEGNDGILNCYNANADAGWRGNIRTHETYCAQCAANGVPLPNLFKIRSLCFEGVTIDVLHAVDQGLASHVVANALVELSQPWGPNQAARAAALDRNIQDWYKTCERRPSKVQGKLTWERLKTSNDWPKLKAKAAATRHLSRFALEEAKKFDEALPEDAEPTLKLHSRRRRAVCTFPCYHAGFCAKVTSFFDL